MKTPEQPYLDGLTKEFSRHLVNDAICLVAFFVFVFICNRLLHWIADRTEIPTFKPVLRLMEMSLLYLGAAMLLVVAVARSLEFCRSVWSHHP